MITITKTRPSITVPFFYDTLSVSDQDTINLLMKTNNISMTDSMSEDGLTHTQVFDCTEADLDSWAGAIQLARTTHFAEREAHNADSGIQISVVITS